MKNPKEFKAIIRADRQGEDKAFAEIREEARRNHRNRQARDRRLYSEEIWPDKDADNDPLEA